MTVNLCGFQIREMQAAVVRIQQRTATKTYMRGKRVYSYDRRSLTITRKYHSLTDAFLDKELTETVTLKNGCLVIVLCPKT